MTTQREKRLLVSWELELLTIEIISDFAKAQNLPISTALDVITSQWYLEQTTEQDEQEYQLTTIEEIKDTVDSIDRRLSRIEQNIMTNGSILAK